MFAKNLALAAAICAMLANGVKAACDNACSGHGTCNADDVCTCYHNWRMGDEDGGDCSDRVCPFEIAWVDHPDSAGKFHNYAECAGRGLCNRESGECECFEGYTGKGCQRTTCPSDCSGHGTCEYIEELGFGSVRGDYYNTEAETMGQRQKFFSVSDFDNHKTMGCVCDPKWTGLDCSRRMCPKGNDIMAHIDQASNIASTHHVQVIQFAWSGGAAGVQGTDAQLNKQFALTFISTLNETYTTYPLEFNDASCTGAATIADACGNAMATAIQTALLALPHRVIDGVTVTHPATSNQFEVTFTGAAVSGNQNLLQVEDYYCGAGCTPMIAKTKNLDLKHYGSASGTYNYVVTKASTGNSDFNNYECGRRGKCDYTSGLCECFEGYYGESCHLQTALI